jgi:hypothetical protein
MTADPRTLVPRPERDPRSRLRSVVSAAMWADEFPPGLRRVRMGATGTRRTAITHVSGHLEDKRAGHGPSWRVGAPVPAWDPACGLAVKGLVAFDGRGEIAAATASVACTWATAAQTAAVSCPSPWPRYSPAFAASSSARRKCSWPVIGTPVVSLSGTGVIPRAGARRTGQAPEIRKPGPAYGDGRDRGRSVSVRTLPGASTGTPRAGRTLDHQALGSHEARQRC